VSTISIQQNPTTDKPAIEYVADPALLDRMEIVITLAALTPDLLTARIADAERALHSAADQVGTAQREYRTAWYRVLLLRYEVARRAGLGA
jgi:hypothetical protein